MTIRQLIRILEREDLSRQVVLSNVLNSPFAVVSIKEVITEGLGPIYIRAENKQ